MTLLPSPQKAVVTGSNGDGFVVSLADLKSVKLKKTSSSGSEATSVRTARRKSFHFGQR